ncbi:MAG: hypothetical protein F2581_01920, partial [Actinobacteria bacterium]|nr:hypothetical protein [Actinomycetota bacterium]
MSKSDSPQESGALGVGADVPTSLAEEQQTKSDSVDLPIFAVRDLSVKYGEFRAVRDVTLDISEHEITA